MSETGLIYKALSGFYYVSLSGEQICCRAPGKFRHEGISPLVGDRVRVKKTDSHTGVIAEILTRNNEFHRPAVANIDQMIIIASAAIPSTDPFLIDRMTVVAEHRSCECVVCINKCDVDRGDELFEIYRKAGLSPLRISAKTGEGLHQLQELIRGKVSAFTGDSGVGKSSILNALKPDFQLRGEVSEKLGRGRHTTRHVELLCLRENTFAIDTPGFSPLMRNKAKLSEKRNCNVFSGSFCH
jgi:ribosome biogenesis GTPase